MRPRLNDTASPPAAPHGASSHVVSDFVPRYYQVYTVLRSACATASGAPDTPMPTEQEFAAVLRRLARHDPQGAQHAAGGRARPAPAGARHVRAGRRRSGRAARTSAGSSRTSSTSSCTPRCACCRSPGSRCRTRPRGCSSARRARRRSRSCACEATASRRSPTRRRYVPEPEAGLLDEATLGNRTVSNALGKAGVATVSAEQRPERDRGGRRGGEAPAHRRRRAAHQHDARRCATRPAARSRSIQALYRPDKYEYRVNLSRDNGDAPRWTVKIDK